jgi:hypothetical protein
MVIGLPHNYTLLCAALDSVWLVGNEGAAAVVPERAYVSKLALSRQKNADAALLGCQLKQVRV